MELVWVAMGQVALPIAVGVLVVALSPRWLRISARPAATGLGLYVVLLVLTVLAAAGGDTWMPLGGALVSVAVSIAVLLALRRRTVGIV